MDIELIEVWPTITYFLGLCIGYTVANIKTKSEGK